MTMTVSEDMSTEESPPLCSVSDCPNQARALGLCQKHYQRQRRHGTTDATRVSNKGPCGVEECGNKAWALGLCEMHYKRQRRTGDVGSAAPETPVPLYERVMRKVDTSAGPHACHPWTGPVLNQLPIDYDGPKGGRTSKSARRVIAHELGLLADVDDQTWWVRMRATCDPLCCNAEHMEATDVGRPGTRKDA